MLHFSKRFFHERSSILVISHRGGACMYGTPLIDCQITSLSRSISFSAVTPYFKGKLKGIYSTALSDAQAEAKLLQDALEKITEIKTYKAKAGLFLYLFFNSSDNSHFCHQSSDYPILLNLNDETIALYIHIVYKNVS